MGLWTTLAGALSATLGVVVGGLITRRSQHRQWMYDKQLATYSELLGHYSRFSMILKRAHADRSRWDYDWGAWSATLTTASLIAPAAVVARIDAFGLAVDEFLDQVARDDTVQRPITPEAFAAASQSAGQAQLDLVNEIRRSLGQRHGTINTWIGGTLARPPSE